MRRSRCVSHGGGARLFATLAAGRALLYVTGCTMETPRTDDAPQSDRGSDKTEPPPSLLRALATMLIGVVLGLVALLLVSALVVYATGVTARRLGLPELHVLVAFLGLVAVVVVGTVGAHIASVIVRASSTVAWEVSSATDEVVEALEEIPAAVIVGPGNEGPQGRGKPRARR